MDLDLQYLKITNIVTARVNTLILVQGRNLSKVVDPC